MEDEPVKEAFRADLIYVDGAFRAGLAVVVENGLIDAVVEDDAIPVGATVRKWAGKAVVPGTVNAHGHSFQNLLRGFADDRPFDEWRDRVLYPFSERLDRDAIYAGALFAFAEALLAGATTTVDFFYLHDAGNDNARAVLRAADDVGIRLVFARAFYDPDAPTGAPARYRESAEDALERLMDLAGQTPGGGLVSVQPAPHSLHAASPSTIALALGAAERLGTPCHLHLAEARYERDQVLERYGTTPVRLLQREGLLTDRLLAVHGVWLDDEELDLLAAAGAGLVHCPGANAFLGDGIARVPEMLERGVRVALGPDGGCANNRQSVFDEMRQASLVAKARRTDGGALDAPTAFRLGTAGGGDVLGLPIGRIAPGMCADLVALDLGDLSLHPLATLDRQVVHAMQATAVAEVVVAGRSVVSGGRLATVPAAEIAARVADATAGWSRPSEAGARGRPGESRGESHPWPVPRRRSPP